MAFDEDGPWQYLKERLTNDAAHALDALTRCGLEEVHGWQARYSEVKRLLGLPDELRQLRTELQEQLSDE